ncbi:MAG: hypothetical protein ACFB0E_00590 [Leptolyngbyaceae cyanobacterium]
MTTIDPDTQKLLRRAVYAYMKQHGEQSLGAARAIAGALLAVQETAGLLTFRGLEAERWVDALVKDFDLSQVVETVWSASEQRLASQVKQWRGTIEAKIRDTLDAYIQTYTPELDSRKIQALVTTILPIVEDATVTRDEAQRLIACISDQVNVTAAIARTIDSKWILIAQKVAQIIQLRNVETAATDVVSAYVHEFQPATVDIGTTLIEQAVQAVSNHKVQLGIDAEINSETHQLLVKQVMLKLHLKVADPPPTKTALEIAQQVRDEVARFRQEQGLDAIDYTPKIIVKNEPDGSSTLGGELSIGLEQ